MVSKGYLMLRSALGRVSKHASRRCSSFFAASIDFLTAQSLEDIRVTRRCLAGCWSFSRSHEHGGGAFVESLVSELNFSTYCKTTHT
jgi:hypothetical protein